MKALIYKGKNSIEWNEYPNPKIIEPFDIIIKVEGFTFSHADYRPYFGQDDSVKTNTIMGHEAVGVITEVGEKVKNLKINDRVAIGCIIHCNQCQWCNKKLYANCINGGFILGTKINGTHSEFVRIPYGENSVIKISDNLSLEDALMLSDVLPTAYENVIQKCDFNKINTVAIIGDGPIGLAVLLLLNQYNKSIDIYGHHVDKLNHFKANNCTNVYNSKNENNSEKKYDLVIECVGNDRGTFTLAQKLIDFNGTIISIGVFKKPVNFEIQDLWHKNITIHTGILNVTSLPILSAMIQNGNLKPNKLVSKIYTSSQVLEAYHQIENKSSFKTVVKL